MNEQVSPAEYLVISRGQWDKDIARKEIQNAIDQFYVWLDRLVTEGKMKTGQRLANEGKTVSRKNVVTDGPFGEAKEVNCGLFYEIRPIDPARATAFTVTTETPREHRDQL